MTREVYIRIEKVKRDYEIVEYRNTFGSQGKTALNAMADMGLQVEAQRFARFHGVRRLELRIR